ncbi:MAG: hypothetical protein J0H31_15170 [Alphaproteobacteria bacterium]|nr:hypothetical protein [Alphaproteobacteria bacterium]
MAPPPIPDIVRQHAEMAAFLWTVYDHHLLNPDENPDMDEERLARIVAQLEAHLDGLRVAGKVGRDIARKLYDEFPEEGELFVMRMLSVSDAPRISELDIAKVRKYIAANLPVA